MFVNYALRKNTYICACTLAEPVSSSPPKINALTYKPNTVESNAETAILCPAQGYPAPSFRLAILIFLIRFYFS